MRKLLAKISAFVLTLASVSPLTGLKANAAEEKTIDMYLVAGQSNAAGYTKTESIPADKMKNVYQVGFDKVFYYGNADSHSVYNFSTQVRLGLGWTASHFGPEIGMAEMITKYSGKQSIIVKCAYGGSGLVDNTSSQSHSYGNWTSPSMINPATAHATKTGYNYNQFIQRISEAVEHYESEGYTINLKGTFWMQGEAEMGMASQTYATALTALINDLREDYATFFEQTNATTAPFVIGKIAPTYMGRPDLNETVRVAQDQVAANMDNVYCVETKDYIIVDPSTGQPAEGCPDQYHFSGKDVLSLGQEVGKAMVLVDAKDRLEVDVLSGGDVKIVGTELGYVKLDGIPIEVTFTPEKYHYLSKVFLDGEEVTDQVVDGKYIFNGTTGVHYLTAEFEKYGQYDLTIETNETKGKLSRDPVLAKYYPDTQIKITPKPAKGYKLKSLTFNGVEVEKTGTFYKITTVQGENKLVAEWEKIEDGEKVETPTDPPDVPATEENNSSCFSGMGILPAILTIGITAFATKKRNQIK